MAIKLSKLCTTSLFLMLFFSPILADIFSTTFNSPETLCNYTPYPSFCKSILPYNFPGTIFDYGRISIHQSLSAARDFLSLINWYLKSSSILSVSTTRALQDCQLLAGFNQDLLIKILESVNYTNSLHSSQAEDLHTLLSAVLTNQETCLDGLQETVSGSSIMNYILETIQNGIKSYSVSLALFTNSWGQVAIKSRMLTERKLEGIDYASVSNMVVVKPDGTGDFTTINDAVAAALSNTASTGRQYFAIYVGAGIYKEYVSIPKEKQNIMMIGDGISQTVITGNRSFIDGWTTFDSATFAVMGQGFVGVNITFRNTAGAIKHQAVAVLNSADMSAFYNCSFEGYQDTLYSHSLRQFYRNCDIYGTIDFIFGNSAVVFQNCNFYPRLPLDYQFNAITAQGRTDPNQNTGISIHNCSIKAASDLASSSGTTKTYLGRPWKEYSRTVYMESYMDSLIDQAGWTEWSGDFGINMLYYAEFCNTGPGSNTGGRVTWPGYHVINNSDAAKFTVSEFVQGDNWLPATAVPYTGGLI